MLAIKEIFDKFEVNAAYTFSTIDGEYPETRIAHLLTYDDEGLYFQTAKVKPFYKQLKETNKVSICSLVTGQGAVTHDENGLPNFEPGYFIKLNGDVRELSNEELENKAELDKRFSPLINDIKRYPTMTTFVLYSFKGEVYDYDFAMKTRDYKLERERFSYGGMKHIKSGFEITDKCIGCGSCAKVCTFKAIMPGEEYSIDSKRCDECGSCYLICPVNAVIPKYEINEDNRNIAGKKLNQWLKTKK